MMSHEIFRETGRGGDRGGSLRILERGYSSLLG